LERAGQLFGFIAGRENNGDFRGEIFREWSEIFNVGEAPHADSGANGLDSPNESGHTKSYGQQKVQDGFSLRELNKQVILALTARWRGTRRGGARNWI
jgi:hypothetical protein